MITKHIVRSCCGKKAYVLQTQKPVKKSHIPDFEQAGYSVPPQYRKVGLFYVQKRGLVATASYGSTKIQVTVSNNSKAQLIEFEKLLDGLTNV